MRAILSRERSKDPTIDYTKEQQFAHHRGLDLTTGYSGFESYPTDLGEVKEVFKVPVGFEELFTPDMLSKINDSKASNYNDWFLGKSLVVITKNSQSLK
jgi:hypothetical protein